MKHLPVPELPGTLERYLRVVRPLLEDAEFDTTARRVREFADGDGPSCQAALTDWAEQENAAGRSWLSTEWERMYLAIRTPLLLTSNANFRLNLPSQLTGIERAADVVHRAAETHLRYLRGEIADEVNPRGTQLDMAQWRVLAGGLSHPDTPMDESISGPAEPEHRHACVLWQGSLYRLTVSDAQGRPASRKEFESALQQVVDSPTGSDVDVTTISCLGSEIAAPLMDEMLRDPANRKMYQQLTDALFVVHLTEADLTEQEHQQRSTFAAGQAWAYKPLSYQVSLIDQFTAVHLEHSRIDGGALRAIVAVMQDLEPVDDGGEPVTVEPMSWTVSDGIRQRLSDALNSYQREADSHQILIERVELQVPATLRISHDALQQWIMLFAQLATYRRVRSTYEAVDAREFQAGRTECLRPNSAEAIRLIKALIAGGANAELLDAALERHKELVTECKTGSGIDRHLFGLRVMADRLGLSPGLFQDEGYRRLTTDFLSTTSVGGAEQVVRFSFAPTSVGGIGVNYTPFEGGYEFCISHRPRQTERFDEVVASLHDGARALQDLLVEVAAADR